MRLKALCTCMEQQMPSVVSAVFSISSVCFVWSMIVLSDCGLGCGYVYELKLSHCERILIHTCNQLPNKTSLSGELSSSKTIRDMTLLSHWYNTVCLSWCSHFSELEMKTDSRFTGSFALSYHVLIADEPKTVGLYEYFWTERFSVLFQIFMPKEFFLSIKRFYLTHNALVLRRPQCALCLNGFWHRLGSKTSVHGLGR